jgi:hypothetical protein
MPNYHTNYPFKVLLHDGREVQLGFNDNQNRVLITETNAPLLTLQEAFKSEGFSETHLEETKPNQISQGLVKRLTRDWDMHVRFLQLHQGYVAIDAEVETSREYLQHIGGNWISVVYEVTTILQKYGIAFFIWHKTAANYVKTIFQNAGLILYEIADKIEWKPIVIGAVAGIALGRILDDEKITRKAIKGFTKVFLNNNKPRKIKKRRSKDKSRKLHKRKNNNKRFSSKIKAYFT